MIVKMCEYPNCFEHAIPHSIYCEKHKQQSDKKRSYFVNARRANTSLYNTPRWRQLRAEVITESGHRCVICGTSSDLTVDHIIPPRGNAELFYDRNNLQVLCRLCHARKTAQEIRDRH